MSQTYEVVWTNGSNPTAFSVPLGFNPVSICITILNAPAGANVSAGTQFSWNEGMPQGIAYEGTNPLGQGGISVFGSKNPLSEALQITSWSAEQESSPFFSWAVGLKNPQALIAAGIALNDWVKLVGVVETGGNTSLNGVWQLIEPSEGTYALQCANTTNPPTFNTYVAGGTIVPYKTAAGAEVTMPLFQPITCVLGSSVVGPAGAQMQALFTSAVAVV